MLYQARNWVSSPLAINILSSLWGQRDPVIDKYLQIYNTLRYNEILSLKSKVFSSIFIKNKNLMNPGNIIYKEQDVHFGQKESARKINSWAYDNNTPVDISKHITPLTNQVLGAVNLFKSTWHRQSDGRPTMKVYNSFNYTDDIKYETRLIELPIKDEFRLVVVVPNGADLLQYLFRKLVKEGLTMAVNSLQPLFTAAAALRAPHIHVDSISNIRLGEEQKILGQRGIQQGTIVIDDKGIDARIATFLVSSEDEPSIPREPPVEASIPVYFAVLYKEDAIITGQYKSRIM